MMARLPRAAAPEFEVWLEAREPALQRTAHLLTGDVHAAQDLVQTTLAKLYLAWPRISRRGTSH
jgi:DNA-directed RNA polymerase specialized sigma24 family protein